MINYIKQFLSGYEQGKRRLPCNGRTKPYENGYRRGIRLSNMTNYDRNMLLAKICFMVAVVILCASAFVTLRLIKG